MAKVKIVDNNKRKIIMDDVKGGIIIAINEEKNSIDGEFFGTCKLHEASMMMTFAIFGLTEMFNQMAKDIIDQGASKEDIKIIFDDYKKELLNIIENFELEV